METANTSYQRKTESFKILENVNDKANVSSSPVCGAGKDYNKRKRKLKGGDVNAFDVEYGIEGYNDNGGQNRVASFIYNEDESIGNFASNNLDLKSSQILKASKTEACASHNEMEIIDTRKPPQQRTSRQLSSSYSRLRESPSIYRRVDAILVVGSFGTGVNRSLVFVIADRRGLASFALHVVDDYDVDSNENKYVCAIIDEITFAELSVDKNSKVAIMEYQDYLGGKEEEGKAEERILVGFVDGLVCGLVWPLLRRNEKGGSRYSGSKCTSSISCRPSVMVTIKEFECPITFILVTTHCVFAVSHQSYCLLDACSLVLLTGSGQNNPFIWPISIFDVAFDLSGVAIGVWVSSIHGKLKYIDLPSKKLLIPDIDRNASLRKISSVAVRTGICYDPSRTLIAVAGVSFRRFENSRMTQSDPSLLENRVLLNLVPSTEFSCKWVLDLPQICRFLLNLTHPMVHSYQYCYSWLPLSILYTIESLSASELANCCRNMISKLHHENIKILPALVEVLDRVGKSTVLKIVKFDPVVCTNDR